MAERLTDKVVKNLPAPAAGNRITYDGTVAGFGARVTAAGAISFVLNYRRKADGRERRYTIGSIPDWSVGAARDEAKRLKRAIDGGADPVGEQQATREAPTVADLCARFEAEHLPRLRPSTQTMYRALIKNEIVPALGTTKVASIEYADIDQLNAKISRRAPYLANRVLGLLSKMFALSIRWGMRTTNPVRGVERNQERKRKRYLSADELARLTKALGEHHSEEVADIFRLCLLTGARRGEVQSATWDQFNLSEGIWTKPAATTKQKTEHEIPLSAPARQLLAKIRKQHDDGGMTAKHVFPGPGPRGYRTGLKRHWAQVCKAAAITGLRMHDLRHSYASHLASVGVGLHVIGALLGHTQPSTTARYAHLFDDPLRQATERVGAIVSGRPSASVVLMKGGRGEG